MFEVLRVLQDLLLLCFVVGVVKGNQPVGIDGVLKVLVNELPDAAFEALGLECFCWSY